METQVVQDDWFSKEEVKSSVTLEEMELLGKKILEGRAAVDGWADKKKEAEAEVVKYEQKMLEILHETSRTSFPLADGTSIYIHRRLSFLNPREIASRLAFHNYLKLKGVFDGMITVNHQTLNSYCKAEYEAATGRGELASIPGIAPPTEFESIGVRSKR